MLRNSYSGWWVRNWLAFCERIRQRPARNNERARQYETGGYREEVV